MLETVIQNQIIFYAMGAAAGIGILSKIISHFTLRRMVRAARKMNKSNHKLMRLVKAKFEHASMISDKVQNVEAFVKKYMYEYKVFGIRLHTWRNLEKKSIWTVGILGIIGTAVEYKTGGMGETVFQYGAWTGVGVVVLFLLHISTDEVYHLQVVENYMIDFLENVCAHRYSKAHRQKQETREAVLQMEENMQEGAQQEEHWDARQEGYQEENGGIYEQKAYEQETEQEAFELREQAADMEDEAEEQGVSREVRIREILEEFLA